MNLSSSRVDRAINAGKQHKWEQAQKELLRRQRTYSAVSVGPSEVSKQLTLLGGIHAGSDISLGLQKEKEWMKLKRRDRDVEPQHS